MTDYVVLRDLSRPITSSPFEGGLETTGAAAAGPGEPRIEIADLRPDDVRSVSRDPEVRAVAPVMPTALIRPVESEDGDGGDEAAPAAAGPAWGITAVGADTSGRTGAGVVPAVLDTGIDATHSAFTGVTLVQQDFSGDGDGDQQGHGSHCAGTVFGRDVDGTRIGVARGVDTALIGKVLGEDGSGDTDMLFRGMLWALQQGARVISMSLGFDFPGLVKRLTTQGWPVELATSAALEAYRANLRMFDAVMGVVRSQEPFTGGTLVVAAAGNESKRNIDPDFEIGASLPAAAEGMVSVGALRQSAQGLVIAPFSNTFPLVSGPGVGVLSAQAGGGLVSFNGTSMATPHVAGVACLWWEEVAASQLPTSAGTVLAKLLATADTGALAPGGDVADRGVGLVRAP